MKTPLHIHLSELNRAKPSLRDRPSHEDSFTVAHAIGALLVFGAGLVFGFLILGL